MDHQPDGSPGARPKPDAVATIRPGDDLVTYVQVWDVAGREAQNRWLDVMHTSIGVLRAKPGFITMTLHRSLDGNRIAVYAQWTSRDTLEAAITDPEAVVAHERMARIGESDGALYTVESVYGPVTPS